eukprot:5719151-Prymnesium_polylepis.1
MAYRRPALRPRRAVRVAANAPLFARCSRTPSASATCPDACDTDTSAAAGFEGALALPPPLLPLPVAGFAA